MFFNKNQNQFFKNVPKKATCRNFVSISSLFKIFENLFSFI